MASFAPWPAAGGDDSSDGVWPARPPALRGGRAPPGRPPKRSRDGRASCPKARCRRGGSGARASTSRWSGSAASTSARPTTSRPRSRIIRAAIDHGVTFMDNCWDYNEGKSHVWMGRALRDGYRQARLPDDEDRRPHARRPAAAQIDQSLRDLGTDVIDLVQIHEVIRRPTPSACSAPDGAIEALVAAQEGRQDPLHRLHGPQEPRIHLQMLEAAAAHHFTFDTVQMPLNVMDAHYDSFERRVLPVADSGGIARAGDEAARLGHVPAQRTARQAPVSPVDCLRYAMGSSASVVITGCESMRDPRAGAGRRLRTPAMNEAERKVILARTAPAGTDGRVGEVQGLRHVRRNRAQSPLARSGEAVAACCRRARRRSAPGTISNVAGRWPGVSPSSSTGMLASVSTGSACEARDARVRDLLQRRGACRRTACRCSRPPAPRVRSPTATRSSAPSSRRASGQIFMPPPKKRPLPTAASITRGCRALLPVDREPDVVCCRGRTARAASRP